MSSEKVNWDPLHRIINNAHAHPTLLRLNQKELLHQCPHLVRELHLDNPKNLDNFQQKASEFVSTFYVVLTFLLFSGEGLERNKTTNLPCHIHHFHRILHASRRPNDPLDPQANGVLRQHWDSNIICNISA